MEACPLPKKVNIKSGPVYYDFPINKYPDSIDCGKDKVCIEPESKKKDTIYLLFLGLIVALVVVCILYILKYLFDRARSVKN